VMESTKVRTSDSGLFVTIGSARATGFSRRGL
jgi:hypothetical protein